MKPTKYIYKFEHINIHNRWRQKWYLRSFEWTIFGLSKVSFSTSEFAYKISLFGIDVFVWINREVNKKYYEKLNRK